MNVSMVGVVSVGVYIWKIYQNVGASGMLLINCYEAIRRRKEFTDAFSFRKYIDPQTENLVFFEYEIINMILMVKWF